MMLDGEYGTCPIFLQEYNAEKDKFMSMPPDKRIIVRWHEWDKHKDIHIKHC